MRASPRILFETLFECVSRMQTAEPVYVTRTSVWIGKGERIRNRTVGCTATAENRITTGVLDSRNDLAGWCGALDED